MSCNSDIEFLLSVEADKIIMNLEISIIQMIGIKFIIFKQNEVYNIYQFRSTTNPLENYFYA